MAHPEAGLLRHMTPDQFSELVSGFNRSYADDWATWASVRRERPAEVPREFRRVLGKWQACRPNTMRQLEKNARHRPPYIEDLLAEAEHPLAVASQIDMAQAESFNEETMAALKELWRIFEQLSYKGNARNGLAGVVGISKAVLLLSDGRVGPAFDSEVRRKLGTGNLESADEWILALKEVARDIGLFESRNSCHLSEVAPSAVSDLPAGRLYDMAFGPQDGPSDTDEEEPEPWAWEGVTVPETYRAQKFWREAYREMSCSSGSGQAIALLRKVIDLERSFAPAHLLMARAFLEMGDLDKVLSKAGEAVELVHDWRSPEREELLVHAATASAEACLRQGDSTRAVEHYRNAEQCHKELRELAQGVGATNPVLAFESGSDVEKPALWALQGDAYVLAALVMSEDAREKRGFRAAQTRLEAAVVYYKWTKAEFACRNAYSYLEKIDPTYTELRLRQEQAAKEKAEWEAEDRAAGEAQRSGTGALLAGGALVIAAGVLAWLFGDSRE